ncbi:LTA synthase family protein [Clostridium akagii]|uniref:LTA synthase family protein n=1 Tax=Clostridium akagii TaxID=91623 RepID=UPI00047A65AD
MEKISKIKNTKSAKILKLIFNKLVVNNLDIIWFLIIISIKEINYNKLISPYFLDYKTAIISSVIVIGSISLLFKNKNRIKYLYIMDILLSIIAFADTLYYRYSKGAISIGTIQNATMLGDVSSGVQSLLKFSDIFYFADIIILIPVLFLYKKLSRTDTFFYRRFIIFLVVFGIGVTGDARCINALDVEQPGLIHTMSNKMYLLSKIGNINFHVIDAYNETSTKLSNMQSVPASKQKEIKQYLQKKDATKGTVLKDAGKGKNLIVIQVEALQQFVIGKKINGEEITPNLNRWLGKSLYFNNYYYQAAAGTTADAEFLSLNSLYPAATGAAYELYPGDTFDSTAKQFNDKGYFTVALNGYENGFWNRNVMYKAEDFSKYFSAKDYNNDEQVGLGLSDKSFLNQTLQKLKTYKEPYYSFMITLSSHMPYDDQKGYGSDFNLGKYKGSYIGNYMNGIHYTDAQLGMFLDKLDNEGILKNSIVVLYGDHFAIPKYEAEGLYDVEGIQNATDLDWDKLQKVPMMIHFPDDANKGVNTLPAGQVDLYPTIANLFNLDKKYMFGTDLLNTNANVVSFRDSSFTDGNDFYVAGTDTYYDIKSGKKIPQTNILLNEKKDTTKQLEYNDEILNHNLIKSFEK